MIVDELAAHCEWVRDFCKTAHLIQAPFPICPETEDGAQAKVWSEDRVPRGLRPKSEDGFVNARWLKAPYHRTAIFGTGMPECGAIFVEREPREWVGTKRGSWLGPAWDGMNDDVLVAHHIMGPTGRGLTWTRVVMSRCGDRLCFARPEDAVVRAVRQVEALPDGAPLEVSPRDRWLTRVWMDINAGATVASRGQELGPPRQQECTDEQLRRLIRPAYYLLYATAVTVATTFSLLNCRNVRTEPVKQAPALRSKKDRWRKHALYRYHVLTVVPFAAKGQRTATALHAGGSVGIHWVRGHFKEYTPDRPLFGKVTGLFWWQEHLAGRARRIIDKDYVIAPPPAQEGGELTDEPS